MGPPGLAIMLIDPYNDFIHEKGKLYNTLEESIKATGTIQHIREVIKAARSHKIPIFYGMHQQTHAHSFQGWQFMNWSLEGLEKNKVFEVGSWGAEYYEGMAPDLDNGDVVVSKHWNSSSFQNTDLDYQLKQRGIRHLVFAGLVANTCIEATARYAYEHTYETTMLTDATAGFSTAQKDAATSLIWQLFANRVMTTEEWIKTL
ncbi:Isochorismatase hydrolase [Rhizodiscina lignyota]|uniref:Isochorismatase hydrolase n=1 Tax=Rhizodiscina lignyota TaxID=1504668 RepID=A0A9P4M5I7_9PEZI|nr:Isochorismatase hydrolase [Rhizodiscina lignyota]